MENTVKRREWVKTAAIIFLSVLLVLTFFSNTIMNRTLPEVSTVEVTDGTISAKVKGTGTVSARGNTEIKSNATTTVASVKVKEGQEVAEGDTLFVLGEQSEELTSAENELTSLQYQLKRYQNSYPDDVSYTAVQNALNDWSSASADVASIKAQMAKIPSAAELASALSDYNNAKAELEALLYAQTQECAKLEAEIAAKIQNEEKYKEDPEYNELLEALEEAKKDSSEIAAARITASEAEAKYNQLKAIDGTTLNTQLELALAAEESAKNAYNSAVDSFNSSVASRERSVLNANIDVAEAQAKVTKLQNQINELKGGEGSKGITAPVAGVIASVAATAGQSIAKGDVLCTIEVPDQGYQISFSVTNDQAKRLKVGDSASVTNFYWGSEVTATVSSIKTDAKNPQTNKTIICDLEGDDISSGSQMTVAIGSKSASYDTIVPKSAVRTDSNGTYVLAIESKTSALGNRYYAKRVDVEQLATDDVNVAVSGNLSYGDFVITTSSEKISANAQVRMADTQ